MRKHPTDLHLEALLLHQSDQGREILLHLCECARCRQRFRSRPLRQPVDERGPDSEIPPPRLLGAGLGFAARLAQERLEAPELVVELLRRPVWARASLLASDVRFRTWGVLELLVERSLAMATRDAEEAEVLAALALLLADHVDAVFYGPERIEDLRARAWGHIANARRVRSDLQGAEKAFTSARSHLRRGTQSPYEKAVLLDLEGSLRRDQRRFSDASKLFQKAEEHFRTAGDLHRAGRSLVNLSTVHYFAGNIEEAIAVLQQATPLIDADAEPRLLLSAQHNLIFYLTEIGRIPEARRVYGETRALYRDFAEPWVQNRRKWVRARILLGLGKEALAESLFLAARDGFVAEGIPYDTALVSLELTGLYAAQGRTADLKRLAEEMLPVFTSLQIHREALAALSYLRQAIEAEQAGVGIVTAVTEFLRRAQHRPELRFEAPGGG